eukprot:5612675-Pyramimonas_sp.AAC.1
MAPAGLGAEAVSNRPSKGRWWFSGGHRGRLALGVKPAVRDRAVVGSQGSRLVGANSGRSLS